MKNDIFSGFFDFNGDGKTDIGEEWIARKIIEDCMKEEEDEEVSSFFDDDFDYDDSDIFDDAYDEADEIDEYDIPDTTAFGEDPVMYKKTTAMPAFSSELPPIPEYMTEEQYQQQCKDMHLRIRICIGLAVLWFVLIGLLALITLMSADSYIEFSAGFVFLALLIYILYSLSDNIRKYKDRLGTLKQHYEKNKNEQNHYNRSNGKEHG